MTAARTLPESPIKLYGLALSGHAHRVEWFLSLLHLPFEYIDVDITVGAQKTAEFLQLNPFGQIPVIQDGAVTLADSNAILIYLAKKYGGEKWLPADPLRAAMLQRWLSVAAGMLAFGPARARRIAIFKLNTNPAEALALADKLFGVMNAELQHSPFLIGTELSLAEIANYAYTALAFEGGISLEPFPYVRAWLQRVESLPDFIPLKKSVLGN
ncbi:MAG: putative glutathione S-transferase [Verrucomicrobiaceae bacterium]|nr:putative glutathione S-transferase [Verrucomicrobiaceae bacterium]